jgi:hypothetical protein
MRRFLVVMVQLLLLTSYANSQSPTEAAQEFGLFGIWALDCCIADATRVGNFRQAMREVMTTDDRIVPDTVTLKAASKIRHWSSHFADGSGTLLEDSFLPSDEGRESGRTIALAKASPTPGPIGHRLAVAPAEGTLGTGHPGSNRHQKSGPTPTAPSSPTRPSPLR